MILVEYSPERYKNASLTKDKQTEAAKHVKTFFSRENVRTGLVRKCLILSGLPGTGKTHVLYALLNHKEGVLKKLFSREWNGPNIGVLIPSFFTEIQYAAFDAKMKFLERAQDVEILCIDDMGMESATEKNVEILEMILDFRYSNMKTTIITTNLPLESFKERYTERILDRLREWGTFVELTDASLRENPDQEFSKTGDGEWERIEADIR